jgi:hypothetical protein
MPSICAAHIAKLIALSWLVNCARSVDRALNDPHVAIAHDVVSAFRHDFLLLMWSQRQRRLLTRCVERSEIEERDHIREDRAQDAKTKELERAPLEWILRGIVAKGAGGWRGWAFGPLDGINLGHRRARMRSFRSTRPYLGARYSNPVRKARCWPCAAMQVEALDRSP